MIAAAASSGLQGAVSGAAGIPVAFFIGMISFFTPCILPLLPGYLSYVSGVSGEEYESRYAKLIPDIHAEAVIGNKLGVTGTPTFFINGTRLVGAQPFDAFKAAIDKELKANKG